MARGRQHFRNLENGFFTESRSDEMISTRSFAGNVDVETVRETIHETGTHETSAFGAVTVPWSFGGSFGSLNFGSHGGSFRDFANFEFGNFFFNDPFVFTPDVQAPARAGLGSINYEYTGDIGVLQTDLLTRDLAAEGGLQAALDRTDSYHLTQDGAGAPSGTGLSDTVVGGTGNDTLFGMSGDDVVLGGNGEDTLYGNNGNDTIYGDVGNDTLSGGAGTDTLAGGAGTNALDGGDGVDTAVFNGSYQDYVISFSGSDVTVKSLDGTTVNDTLTGIERIRFGSDLYSVDALQNASTAGTVPASLDTADTPTLSLPGTITAAFPNGTATLSVPLDISAALTDTDGSETLHVRVSGLPTGATLSAGAAQSDGSWFLSAGDIAGVTIDLPPSVASDFQLTIVAEAQESADGSIAVVDGVVTVDVVAWAGAAPSSVGSSFVEPTQIDPDSIVVPGAFEGGKEIWVGAGQAYTDLQSAVDASGVNDTIYITAGTYDFNEVKIDHTINIIGVGDVTLTAADRVYKGLLVTKPGVSLYVENITFDGAVSWDRNGAGIRHSGADLIVVNSHFNGNENGILGAADGTGDMYIVGSTFDRNGYGDGYSHGIYIKGTNNLIVLDSDFTNTKIGHHIKSLAHNTYVFNSLLDDGDGQSSYSIEVSDGGDLFVEGNTIIQSADGDSNGIIAYSVNRGGDSGFVQIEGNTIINSHSNGILFRNWSDAVGEFTNNTFTNSTGASMILTVGLADFSNNTLNGVLLADSSFSDGATLGTGGADEIFGTAGDDVLNGLAGDDVIRGGVSDSDTANGKDLLLGGEGNDQLYGGRHADYLLGEAGNDFLDGGDGDDLLAGGAGGDVLIGGAGSDILIGGDGDDLVSPGGSLDIVNGGTGLDVAFFENSYSDYAINLDSGRWYVKIPSTFSDWGTNKLSNFEYFQFSDGVFVTETASFHAGVILATYQDFVTGQVSSVTIPDELKSTSQSVSSMGITTSSDPVADTAKSSTFEGMAVNSLVYAAGFTSQGVTRVGTPYDDVLTGTSGGDVFDGAGGKDAMYGGLGDDIYMVDSSNDHGFEEADAGVDTVVSSANWQDLMTNVENLILTGSNNSGGAGNGSDNMLIGNEGDNTLKAGGGSDYLSGGYGNDTLTGGAGSDVFIFDHASSGRDTITDFDLAQDFISLSADLNGNGLSSSEAILSALYNDVNGFATLDLGDGNSITFSGLSADQFSTSDFVLS